MFSSCICEGCGRELAENRSSSVSVQYWIRDGRMLCYDCFIRGITITPQVITKQTVFGSIGFWSIIMIVVTAVTVQVVHWWRG